MGTYENNPANRLQQLGVESGRTTITLSVTEEDKRRLKVMAAERGTSVSALLHEWLVEHEAKEARDGQ